MEAGTLEYLTAVLRQRFGTPPQFRGILPVQVVQKGQRLWSGEVAVFSVPSFSDQACYAWLENLTEGVVSIFGMEQEAPDAAVMRHLLGQCRSNTTLRGGQHPKRLCTCDASHGGQCRLAAGRLRACGGAQPVPLVPVTTSAIPAMPAAPRTV